MKNLFLCLSFLFLFTLIPHQTQAMCSGFTDVDENVWYCDTIDKLRLAGVLRTNPTFDPDQLMTRDQAIKVIYEIAEQNIPDYGESIFDISAGADANWYRKYFSHAYGSKFIQPENGKMNPQKPIQKSEFLVLLLRVFKISATSESCMLPAIKIPSSGWVESSSYKGYLCKALELEIAKSGYDDVNITRAVAMQMIYNAMK